MAVTNPFGNFYREAKKNPAKPVIAPHDDAVETEPAEASADAMAETVPAAKEETAETVQETVSAQTVPEPDEVQPEPKPKKHRRTKAEKESEHASEPAPAANEEAAEETVKPAEEPAPAKVIAVKYNASAITTQDIADKFSPVKEDLAWKEFETDIRARVDDIKIKADINLGSARILLEQVTDVLVLLNNRKAEINAYDAVFNDKVIGIIQRAKTANATGKNQDDRDKSANSALEVLPWGRAKINIFDYVLAHNARKQFIYSMIDSVKEKQTAIFNYIAIMKLEQKIIS